MAKFGVILGEVISAIASVLPAYGAERISFHYAPFGQFILPVKSLETFAKTGEIDSDFAYYARFATPQDLVNLRDLLQRRFDVTPTMVSQFTYSPLGETVVQRLGNDFQTDIRENGFYALRAAFILAAGDPDGLTIVNMLRKFPSHTVWFNLPHVLGIIGSVSDLFKHRDSLIAAIQQDAIAEASQTPIDFSQRTDLRKGGPFHWQKELLLFDRHHHFIEMPFICGVGTFAPKLIGILLPEFLAPFPDRFVGDFEAAIQHHLLDIPVAQGKGVIQPDTVANNFARKSMTGVHASG